MSKYTLKRHSIYCKEYHVICVDDDPYFLKSMSFVLSESINAGGESGIYYRCTFLDNPLEALKLIETLLEKKETLAMVICDQKMPQMKGIEFLAKVKGMIPNISTVLLTGYAGMDSAIDAINNKLLDKYLTKPIEDENDFIVSIQHLLKSFTLNQKINEQNKTIYELFDFSNKLNSISNFEEALEYIVNYVKILIGCENAFILLFDEKKKNLNVVASSGMAKSNFKSYLIPTSETFISEFIQNRKATHAKSMSDVFYLKEMQNLQSLPFISMPLAYINLISGDEPLGVLNVSHKLQDHPFEDLDLANLTYVANTASIAIHNHINLYKLNNAYIEAKTKAITLEHQLTHDQLTGLPNRIRLVEYIKQIIDKHKQNPKKISLLLMGIKHFQEINDTLGHHNGDILLKQVAQRLDDNLGKSGMLARTGADIFSFVMLGANCADVDDYFQAIKALLREPFIIGGINIDVSMSFGVASYPEHGMDANLLLQKAEIAMYAGKSSYSELSVYAPDSDQYDAKRLSLMSELRAAIENEELILYYQPKINLLTQDVTSAEALVRWKHPIYGMLPPDQFIPLAEQAGLMKPLTEWVLRESIRQNSEWNESNALGKKISIAVNLSTANLLEMDLPTKITELLNDYHVEASQLELEVTESSVMSSPEVATNILKRLSSIGIKIAIDDYGTGHSSLSYIKTLPVDYLKIARVFIKNILLDARDMHIVKSTIELGHHLGIEVIAEGIEDQQTCAFLKHLGCDSVQGFYFSRPLPPQEFITWIIRENVKEISKKQN